MTVKVVLMWSVAHRSHQTFRCAASATEKRSSKTVSEEKASVHSKAQSKKMDGSVSSVRLSTTTVLFATHLGCV